MRKTRFDIGVTLLLIAIAAAVAANGVMASSDGPPNGRTGAPGEGTCASCHSGGPGGGSVAVSGAPAEYVLGATYSLTVTLQNMGQSRWGFQLTAVDADGNGAGTITADDPQATQVTSQGSKQYFGQRETGTYAGTEDGPVTWTGTWTAPLQDVGTIGIYVAGNAANNNGGSSGDSVYTASVLVEAPSNPPTDTPAPSTPTPTNTPVANTSTPTDTPAANTPTPTPTAAPGTPTPTPTAAPGSPTPTPTTGSGTPTPTPTTPGTPPPTPTLPAGDLTLVLDLSQEHFLPGDTFQLDLLCNNATNGTLESAPVFAILEVFGSYYFWPGWTLWDGETGLDWSARDLPAGDSEIAILQAFVWPDTGPGRIDGLNFFAAVLNAELTSLFSNLASVTWGYGD